MKIQGELNGIKIDIEYPEIIHQEGKWWEPVGIWEPASGERYLELGSNFIRTTSAYKNRSSDHRVIYREIPEPSQEWLDKNGFEKSARPEKLLVGNTFWNNGSVDIVRGPGFGKYRFKLTPKPAKSNDELAREYAQAFLANDISAGQLLTKLEELKV